MKTLAPGKRDESNFSNLGEDRLEVYMPAKQLLQKFASIWSGVSSDYECGPVSFRTFIWHLENGRKNL